MQRVQPSLRLTRRSLDADPPARRINDLTVQN